jgi:hypothetical protein
MGTNYYVEDDPTCNNPAHTLTLHIGKSSAGWVFGFRAYPEKGLISWAAWQAFLLRPGGEPRVIVDEYGREQKFEEFRDFVEAKQRSEGRPPDKSNYSRLAESTRRDPNLYGYYRPADPEVEWLDPEGYDFYAGEFS